MNILVLPNDVLYHMSKFLSATDKISLRESCVELNNNVELMDIRIELMNNRVSRFLDGRMYILSRLRLASLCGLDKYTVANIWSWIVMISDSKTDSLPILRQIGQAIYKNNLI